MFRILGTRRILFALMLSVMGLGSLDAQQSLTIGSGSIAGTGSTALDVTMTSTGETEGFVLSIGVDAALLQVSDLGIAGTVTEVVGAELVTAELYSDGATLAVVLDATPPFDGQTIAAGTDQLIAQLDLASLQLVAATTDTAITFVDGIFGSPTLSNLIVQGGLSIEAVNGLGLNDGLVSILPPPPSALRIESTSIDSDGAGDVRILLDNNAGETQGFVLSIAHDAAALTLLDIDLAGTAAAAAELVVTNIYADGGTVGVVLETDPSNGQTAPIPAGLGLHIADFTYACDNEIEEPAPALDTTLTFVNGQFGAPALDNIVVVGGLSVSPALNSGTVTCLPVPPPPASDTAFYVGPTDFSLTGEAITNCFPGEEIELCLFYSDPTDNLQGLQMGLCYGSDLTIIDGTLDLDGTIVDEIGAEYVNYNIDNSTTDGDGHEFLLGILMDVLPPFDNQMLPATTTPLAVACVKALVSPNAPCGEVLTIDFCNNINGAGSVFLNNTAVIDYASELGIGLYSGGCMVIPETLFRRGDCNVDELLDLSDAATTLGYQFDDLAIACEDACDANDDGKVNLADTVYILNYLYSFGPIMPAPGPNAAGSDPTEDELTCDVTPAC
jgi:hypothetical protein